MGQTETWGWTYAFWLCGGDLTNFWLQANIGLCLHLLLEEPYHVPNGPVGNMSVWLDQLHVQFLGMFFLFIYPISTHFPQYHGSVAAHNCNIKNS